MKRVNFVIANWQADILDELQKKKGINKSQIVRIGLKMVLEELKKRNLKELIDWYNKTKILDKYEVHTFYLDESEFREFYNIPVRNLE